MSFIFIIIDIIFIYFNINIKLLFIKKKISIYYKEQKYYNNSLARTKQLIIYKYIGTNIKLLLELLLLLLLLLKSKILFF